MKHASRCGPPLLASAPGNLAGACLYGTSHNSLFFVDSRLRGNDGNRRLERAYSLDVPFATAEAGLLTMTSFRMEKVMILRKRFEASTSAPIYACPGSHRPGPDRGRPTKNGIGTLRAHSK